MSGSVGLLVAALAGALFTPAAALADAAAPPAAIHVEGRASSVTGRSAPDHALFVFRNASDGTAEVFLYRALLRADGMAVPMEITAVAIDGERQGERTIRVPARGQVPVTVFFRLPENQRRRSSWDVDLRITANASGGGWETTPAHVTRASRDPRKRVTGPKARAATPRAPRR